MLKKLFSLLITLSMLSAFLPMGQAFADAGEGSGFEMRRAVIQNIVNEDGRTCYEVMSDEGFKYNLLVSDTTLFVDRETQKLTGDYITEVGCDIEAYYRKTSRWNGREVLETDIIVGDYGNTAEVTQAYIARFNDKFFSSDGLVQMKTDGNTSVIDQNGSAKTKDDAVNKVLLLLYDAYDFNESVEIIYSKTVIIIDPDSFKFPSDKASEEVQEEPVTFNGSIYAGGKIITVEPTEPIMVPVREVSEALGYSVGWNEELGRVSVGSYDMGITLAVGDNSYTKAGNEPIVLDIAPTKVNDSTTYVPLDFFSKVLGAAVTRADKSVYIDALLQQSAPLGSELTVAGKTASAPPLYIDAVLWLPVRAVAEGLGCTVDWSNSAQTVTVAHSAKVITFAPNGTDYIANDGTVYKFAPARLIDDVTYVPTELFSEGFGAVVNITDYGININW